MQIINHIIENYTTYIIALTSVIGGASIIARAIAPLTKTKKDDKLAKVLTKALTWLHKLSLNSKPTTKG